MKTDFASTLTGTLYAVLDINRDTYCPVPALCAFLWPDTHSLKHRSALSNHVLRLNAYLKDTHHPDHVVSVRPYGYRLESRKIADMTMKLPSKPPPAVRVPDTFHIVL